MRHKSMKSFIGYAYETMESEKEGKKRKHTLSNKY